MNMTIFERICTTLAPFVTARNADHAILAGNILYGFAGVMTVVIIAMVVNNRRQSRQAKGQS